MNDPCPQTWAAICTFILGMIANPEAQKAAQAELDAFLAPGELPTFRDEQSLPYIIAIVKEVYRWKPVTPLCESFCSGHVPINDISKSSNSPSSDRRRRV
jgi:hypothetical protein